MSAEKFDHYAIAARRSHGIPKFVKIVEGADGRLMVYSDLERAREECDRLNLAEEENGEPVDDPPLWRVFGMYGELVEEIKPE